ncbi:MAG: YihA family ribosome biogenesis GTP-binding protein [Bacteroidetes bacterium]|nr:MAG: YihA family ribosome biogenesis GTP-binding protein [Bacteroidota bacterium]
MDIKEAEFVISQTDYTKCPAPVFPEYAFIGRSNVGKSSLINMLTNRKGLAKTSATPGKTQLINHFFINEQWYLVDLPGYGYARVSKANKSTWDKMIRDYLKFRTNLMYVFVLIDVRLSAQKNDLEFIHWLGENEIPFVLVFTKADKLSAEQVNLSVEKYRKKLSETWEELMPMFVSSAEKKRGREEILEFIEKTKTEFKAPANIKKKNPL